MALPDRRRVTAPGEITGALAGREMAPIRFMTAEQAVLAVADRDDLDSVYAVLNDEMDYDVMIALVSVLAVSGIESFETFQPDVVQRILAMHRAISTGAIEVLGS